MAYKKTGKQRMQGKGGKASQPMAKMKRKLGGKLRTKMKGG